MKHSAIRFLFTQRVSTFIRYSSTHLKAVPFKNNIPPISSLPAFIPFI